MGRDISTWGGGGFPPSLTINHFMGNARGKMDWPSLLYFLPTCVFNFEPRGEILAQGEGMRDIDHGHL